MKREGAVAQLGERLLCKQEVIGSIPFSSTISIDCEQRSTFVVGIQRRALRAAMFFNNSEGKASIGLDESRIDDRVELYLVRAL